MDLRKKAKGQECQIRIPGVCNRNPDTVVLAHYRLMGYCGERLKPDDFIFGAWGCSSCHDLCDGRTKSKEFTRDEIRLAHAEGVMRTQAALFELGCVGKNN
jgi:hypothetical protein